MNHLLSEGHQASRINTQGQWDEAKGLWRPSGSTKSTSDILACLYPAGRFLAVEVKFDKDDFQPGQEEWLADVQAAGGLFWVAKNYEGWLQYYELLKKNGICRMRPR